MPLCNTSTRFTGNLAPSQPDGSPADTRLQLLAGYACHRCPYRTVSRDLIRRHLSQEHLQQQRASSRQANGLYDDVYLQTWSQSSSRQYWTVIHQAGAGAAPGRGGHSRFYHDAPSERGGHPAVDGTHPLAPDTFISNEHEFIK
ncbi:hypothetical protein N7471_010761 [Penicillium samsonianum]|uniref:uncharacterized protein n=1 Tax=Penicillium samsonianum TaxID=1882272 RepID=UPI002546F07B|nr:uncharacterized protein N7471_010761 [Penicillium samsonianum]KAJ6126268.1 hypothetical protein N7471_010761 [Penicillium samsonianum]